MATAVARLMGRRGVSHVLAAVIFLGAGIGIGSTVGPNTTKTASPKTKIPVKLAGTKMASPSYLFSIPTSSGSLLGPNDQHLTLTLKGTRDYLTQFTDRPLRDAYVAANVDFERRFAKYF